MRRVALVLAFLLTCLPAVWAGNTEDSTTTLTIDPSATSGTTITAADENDRGNDISTWGTAHVHSFANTTSIGDGLAGTKDLCFDAADTTDMCFRFDDTNNMILMSSPVAGTFGQVLKATGTAGLTEGGLLLGGGTGEVTALGVATNGQIPIGDGTTGPTLATITGTADEITVTNGGGSITLDIPDPLIAGKGGTGAASLTDGGILLGSGTGAITPLGVATNGQIPIGDGTTDPVLATITQGTGITVTNGAGSITIAATSSTTVADRVENDSANTTTSTSFVDIGTANQYLITMTTGANPVVCGFSAARCAEDTVTAGVCFNFNVDGSADITNGICIEESTAAEQLNCSWTWMTADLTAASHTFEPQFRVTGSGTATADSGINFWCTEETD